MEKKRKNAELAVFSLCCLAAACKCNGTRYLQQAHLRVNLYNGRVHVSVPCGTVYMVSFREITQDTDGIFGKPHVIIKPQVG